jgi:predicted metalloprotease with PDZ domain
MIEYRLDLSLAHAHRFVVTLRVKPVASQLSPHLTLSLPAWIPGSYLVREFARHLNQLRAHQGGQACNITQVDKATWHVACRPGQVLTVQYEVYAFDTSVRAAYLDHQRGFFNGTGVCLRVHGCEDQPHSIQLDQLPKGWDIATAMLPASKAKAPRRFQASSYDELADHPVELGTFWRGQFTARGVPHEFVVAGHAPNADLERLLKDTQRICETQIDFWHGRKKATFDRYVFMLNVVDDGYGGLEHRNSTALICSRRDLPRQSQKEQGDGYTTLLGLISHEYFHTWNVKRLKPKEFAPYDYTQENYTHMLWFFEGFTSYYDDVLLLRAGLINGATYLKLLTKPINQVLATPGRHVQSVAQASFDAWVRYYRPDENTANSTVSYYTKGSLLALALDLTLRALPKQSASLDGVMKRLWALQRPIEAADVAQALADEATVPPPGFKDWASLLNHWVHGTDDLPLSGLLAQAGVQWKPATSTLSQRIGVRLNESPQGLKVSAVMRGSPAEAAGLSAGDELLALDGWRLKRADDWQALAISACLKPLLISRDMRLHTLTLPLLDSGPTAWCQVISLEMETPAASPSKTGKAAKPAKPTPSMALRKGWLGC